MRKMWTAFIFMVCFVLPVVVFAQAAGAPAPTKNSVSLYPPGREAELAWLKNIHNEYGIGGFIALFLAALIIAGLIYLAWRYFKGLFGKTAETKGVSDAETILKNIEISDATKQYLEKVSITYRRFKFRSLPRTVAKGIKPPELDQAYVSVCILPESSVSVEGTSVEEKKEKNVLERIEQSAPVDLASALRKAANRKLALTGVAGSGKSTLLQWAGLVCARACLGQELKEEQAAFIEAFDGKKPLPFLIPLRAYSEYCRKNNVNRCARSLLDFMAHHFSENQADGVFDVDFFKKNLKQPCFLMLDGVDEVEPEDRAAVRLAIEDLLAEAGYDHPHMYCLLTTRPSASYISLQMTGFDRCDIQLLTPAQRNDLIRFWHSAVYAENRSEAEKRAAELISRIEAAPPSVRDLAVTPLMTTIFCMVSYSHELPRLRARLYEDAVEVLLTETTFKEGEDIRGLDEWGGVDPETRRDRLAFIAFELQKNRLEKIFEADLVELIWKQFGAEKNKAKDEARRFLQAVAQRGGLLEAVGDEYGFFTHATFREYLAGRYLAEEMSSEEQLAFLREYGLDDQWEESLRLAAGYLSIKGQNKADLFIKLLMNLGENDSQRTHSLTLAGLALSDIHAERRIPDTVHVLSQDMLSTLTANPPVANAPVRLRLGGCPTIAFRGSFFTCK